MAFLQNGTWVPDQSINSSQNQGMNNPMPVMQAQAGSPQIAQQGIKMQTMPQAQMQFQPQFSNPNFHYNPGANPMTFMSHQLPQNQNPISNPVQSFQPISTINAAGMLPSGPPNAGQSQPAFNPMTSYAQMQAPQSLTQSINHSDPQAVQNFLHALSQSPQAGQTNAWRNPLGMHGQQAQAGFQGFQQNGQPGFQGQGAVQYNQPQGQQLGWAANQATGGTATGSPQQSYGPGYGGGGRGPSEGTLTGGVYKPGSNSGPPVQSGQSNSQQGAVPPNYNGQPGGHSPHAPPGPPQAASDINSKQNIRSGDSQLQEFLNSLNAYSYEYKDPKYGDGRRISPMAQEIEKTPIGKVAISTNEEGYKIVDYGKLGGTMLASLALLNHKYNKLEEELKSSITENLKLKGKIK